jgi:2-polyprenyl-3-methyl-5-hydroxy-6-metoxy-1,4-benzoquinol methylase
VIKNMASELTCPLCGAKGDMPSYFKQQEPRLKLCPSCSVVFVHPRNSGAELLKQYSPEYHEKHYESTDRVEYVNPLTADRKQRFFLEQAAQFTGKRPGSVLDIGCGTGRVVVFAKSQGWESTGLELCVETGKETAARLHCQVYLGSIFDAELPKERFDVVTMFDCIEHLEDPVGALAICRQVLKPDGLLIVTTPNFQGLGRLMLGPQALGIWPDTHIIYFRPRSLRFALQQAKFDGIKTASREIYPENVATILAHLRGKKENYTREFDVAEPAVWSIKRRFRDNSLLQAFRTGLNTFFGVVPVGDDLFAFAVKR